MSREAKNESLSLLNEILICVKHIGVKGVTTLLENARSKTLSVVDENVEFVFKMVSNHYLIPIDEIVNSKSKVVKKLETIELIKIGEVELKGKYKEEYKKYKNALLKN